jgi:Alginate export
MALNAGSRRLVSSEDWRNTTNSYTGLRGDIVLPKGLSATGFYVQPTIRLPDDKPNLIDNAYRADRESSAVILWGGLATKANLVAKANAEVSFYHFEEKDSAGRPTRDRRLDTVGGRFYREPALGHADFEVEVFQQSGEISRTLLSNAAKQSVSAQFLHADLGYSFAARWRPRVSARYDVISGDRGGSHYGRFDTLFGMRGAELAPSGLYNTVGRANLISPGLSVELSPNRKNDLYLRYRPLWLASRTDSFSTSNVRDINGKSGNFAGNQVEVRWRRWLIVDALRFEVNGTYLAKGRFLRDAPNSPRTSDTNYGAFNLTAYF